MKEVIEKRLESFTKREQQVFDLLMDCKSSKNIARELKISLRTVDFHRRNIVAKMHADTILEVARMKHYSEIKTLTELIETNRFDALRYADTLLNGFYDFSNE